MSGLQVAATAELADEFVRQLRTFLDTAYDGDFSDDDWPHACGGQHVWLSDGEHILSHGSLVERTLVCAGVTLRVGYVEAVATAHACRGRGHGTVVMQRIGEMIREGYPLGALSTGAYGFYEKLGWERWIGRTFAQSPNGIIATPDDDDDIMILRTPRTPTIDVTGAIVADWRTGDVW
jgi:aminoglycoside 2'-N-acetyltransferase I